MNSVTLYDCTHGLRKSAQSLPPNHTGFRRRWRHRGVFIPQGVVRCPVARPRYNVPVFTVPSHALYTMFAFKKLLLVVSAAAALAASPALSQMLPAGCYSIAPYQHSTIIAGSSLGNYAPTPVVGLRLGPAYPVASLRSYWSPFLRVTC